LASKSGIAFRHNNSGGLQVVERVVKLVVGGRLQVLAHLKNRGQSYCSLFLTIWAN
jgi:hypothetical protein